jgi:K+-sensing histidine kinase KdpD
MDASDRDLNLGKMQHLLGNCLGRIDAHASQLLNAEVWQEFDSVDDALGDETGQLQELVNCILETTECQTNEDADLNRVVGNCARSIVQATGHPLLVRQRLGANLPLVACSAGMLTCAVQRALSLAAAHAGSGGELIITTRSEGDDVLFELHSSPGAANTHLKERALTLRAFVAQLHGRCNLAVDTASELWLVFELPMAFEIEDRR